MFKSWYKWMGSRVHSKFADIILVILFYFEALIFIIPTDPMLIIYCIERRDRAYWYAFLATVGSVLGGMTGYAIGYYIWQYYGQSIIHNPFVNVILKPSDFYYLCDLYKEHEYLAIFIAGFTPVPYKAATFTAGFCQLAFMPFVLCSFIARGARFLIYAVVISIWGEQIKKYIDRYFGLLVLLIIVLISGSIWLCRN
ncbi:MAG: VTT domain-containing protein [Candidatus Dependentiae bacterium]